MVDKEKSLELKKHVGAIHSNNRLTLVQRKIANALLYNAYDGLMIADEHIIHIKTLCELIGYDSKDFKAIKRALVALISTVIEWNLVDKDRSEGVGIWNASSIISDASINGPICTYSYSKKMRGLLYRPELYGRINLQIQSCFKSSYGLVLYENCIRYQSIQQTPWFEMPVFRKLMGIDEGKYIIFRDFKRRVLDKGIEEVNEFSPITIFPTLRKQAGKVIAIRFSIRRTGTASLKQHDAAGSGSKTIATRLEEDFGFSKTQTEKVLAAFDEQYILEKIAIVESSPSFQDGKIINLSKYLESALEHNFKAPKSSKERVKALGQQKQQSLQLQKLHGQFKEPFRRYQDQAILEYHAELSGKAKLQLEKQFEIYIKGSLHHTLFQRDGLGNILVADRFCEFIRAHHKDLLAAFLSLEQFILEQQPSSIQNKG